MSIMRFFRRLFGIRTKPAQVIKNVRGMDNPELFDLEDAVRKAGM